MATGESSHQELPDSTLVTDYNNASKNASASQDKSIDEAATVPPGAAMARMNIFTTASSPAIAPASSSSVTGMLGSPLSSFSEDILVYDTELDAPSFCSASTPITTSSKSVQPLPSLDPKLRTPLRTSHVNSTNSSNQGTAYSFMYPFEQSEDKLLGEKLPLLSTSGQNGTTFDTKMVSPSPLSLTASIAALNKIDIGHGIIPDDSLVDEYSERNSTAWWDDLYQNQPGTASNPTAYEGNDTDHQAIMSAVKHRDPPWKTWIPKQKITEMNKFFTPKNLQMIFVGSTVYTLYNLVFCLAMASSINVPHRNNSMLGPIAKLCIMGVVAGVPLLLTGLSAEHPALYSVFDLFLAPFLAEMGSIVDSSMYEQSHRTGEAAVSPEKYSDAAFLTTYTFLVGIGLTLTALGTFLATHVKLANIGEYLPYAVLCGFFSTVGVTLWTLAISVDTGLQIQTILFSKNWDIASTSLIHHLPSALIGTVMYECGPRNPLLVPFLALSVVAVSHLAMFLCNVSLEEAQRNNWFWTAEDLVYSVKVRFDLFG